MEASCVPLYQLRVVQCGSLISRSTSLVTRIMESGSWEKEVRKVNFVEEERDVDEPSADLWIDELLHTRTTCNISSGDEGIIEFASNNMSRSNLIKSIFLVVYNRRLSKVLHVPISVSIVSFLPCIELFCTFYMSFSISFSRIAFLSSVLGPRNQICP